MPLHSHAHVPLAWVEHRLGVYATT